VGIRRKFKSGIENLRWTFDAAKSRSLSHNAPFGGWEFTGMVVATIVGGKIAPLRDAVGWIERFPASELAGYFRRCLQHRLNYSATISFSITTFKCAVTSLCSFTGTVNSPRVFSGSWSWICFRSRLIPFFTMASAMSPEVTEPNS